MIESFVDLTYRGLPLGRRVKLTQVRPSTGYLELPAPMPVGTTIAIATDEGVVLAARVTGIHEQVGGSDRAPGMLVTPALAEPAAAAWWSARVALPEVDPEEAKPARGKAVTVRPRSHAVSAPPPDAVVAEPPAGQAGQAGQATLTTKTTVMNAVDQELLEQLTRDPSPALEKLVRSTGEHEVVDDGKRTTVMDAVDPATLGLDVAGSGPLAAASADDDDDGGNTGDDKKITAGGTVKKRKKKRG